MLQYVNHLSICRLWANFPGMERVVNKKYLQVKSGHYQGWEVDWERLRTQAGDTEPLISYRGQYLIAFLLADYSTWVIPIAIPGYWIPQTQTWTKISELVYLKAYPLNLSIDNLSVILELEGKPAIKYHDFRYTDDGRIYKWFM